MLPVVPPCQGLSDILVRTASLPCVSLARPQGFTLVNLTQPGRLPVFQCQAVHNPWYVRLPWVLPVSIIGLVLVLLAALFLTLYRKGARPAFVQQYINVRKRLKVRQYINVRMSNIAGDL